MTLAIAGSALLSGQAPIARPNVVVNRLPSIGYKPVAHDFNNDGRIDVVGAGLLHGPAPFSSELTLRLGNGDGTFGAPSAITVPASAAALAAGDLNGDGNADLFAVERRGSGGPEDRLRPLWILPGRGDGTFGSAITIGQFDTGDFFFFPAATAVIDDFDGDTRLDIAVTNQPDGVKLYRGRGDFTFDAPLSLTSGESPNSLATADLNADGRRDLVVASRTGQQVNIFMNRGGFAFGLTSIPVDRAVLGVSAADLNGDSNLDLLVAASTEDIDFAGTFHDGRALVMPGNGDGTFQSPASYALPRGTRAIVAGDFNRDGRLDVATANQTWGDEEECGPLWGSVSILPGDGTGALGAPASFQLSYDPADYGFGQDIDLLFAARVDGDEHLDLIAPQGVLLNRPAASNRAPSANAGPDRTVSDHNSFFLEGQASDPDNDYLTFAWTDETGRRFESCLQPFASSSGPGQHTYTLTVDDGRGGVSTDSATVNDVSTNNGPFFTLFRPQFDKPVPSGAPYLIQWSASDPDGGQIVDIDISVDRNGQNNFTPIPGCTNLSGTASECVWNDPGPPSDNAALLFRIVDSQGDQANTVARFQIVDGVRGALPAGWSNGDVGAVGAAGAAGFDGRVFTVRGSGADIWDGADEFHWAFTTRSGDFEFSARVANVQNINAWTKAGLMIRESGAAGSRHASIFATPGTQKPVSFQRRPATNGPSISTAGSIVTPPVWLMLRRTGDTIAAFYRASASAAWTPLGSQTVTGLASSVQVGLAVSSHVDGTLATAVFDGVALPTEEIPDAPVVDLLRPSRDEQVQLGEPYTIRWLPRGADTGIQQFDAYFGQSATGPWTRLFECAALTADQRSCVWQYPGAVGSGFIRLITTGKDGATAETVSGPFQIARSVTGAGGTPPGWTCGDVGAVGAAGSCSYDVDDELIPDFVVRGSGADVWDTADEFSYARYGAYGDFSITARVVNVQNINRWTKAGIMIRDWNGVGVPSAGSRHAFFFATPSTEKGLAFQRRQSNGGISVHTSGPAITAPVWLKLVRTGNTISAYYRTQGVGPWTFVGSEVYADLPYELSAMLVVSSHVDGTLAQARFDDVSIRDALRMQSVDIGNTIPGTTTVNGTELTIEGEGADIWGTEDAFRFHYTNWRGDGYVIASVRSLEATHAWAKAGVMIRTSLHPTAPHVMAIVSPGKGVAMQGRSFGQTSVSTTPIARTAPGWLMLRRFGNTFTSSWSLDGETWTFVGEMEIPMGMNVLVGLPVTSHSPGNLATAVFDDVRIGASIR